MFFTYGVLFFFYFTVDLPIDEAWSGRIQEQCVKMVDHTPLSEQQVAQLMRSLILVEQVRISPISPDYGFFFISIITNVVSH